MQDTGGFSLGLQSAGLQDTLVPRKNTGDAEKKTEDESSPWIINEPDACDSVSYWMSISELLYMLLLFSGTRNVAWCCSSCLCI